MAMCSIIIVLPEPPHVQVNLEQNEVCFYSLPVQGIHLDNYEVLIYDITGEQTFNMTVSNSTNCTIVEANVLQNLECAPFMISVKAVNSHGFSDTNTTITVHINSSTEGDICTCLTNKCKSIRILTT